MAGANDRLRSEIAELKKKVAALQDELARLEPVDAASSRSNCDHRQAQNWCSSGHGLSAEQVARYSRHLILPAFGAAGGWFAWPMLTSGLICPLLRTGDREAAILEPIQTYMTNCADLFVFCTRLARDRSSVLQHRGA